MCTVSFIGEHYQDKFTKPEWDWLKPYVQPDTQTYSYLPYATKAEFDALKKEVEEMKKLLIGAKAYDERNNEPNCEMEDKIKMLREVAKLVGVDLDEVFKPKA